MKVHNFILLDDVTINNMLTRIVIKDAYPGASFEIFTEAVECIKYLEKQTLPYPETILLLDIYMPDTDGWQFLEEYDKLNEAIKQQIKIFALTSSILKNDRLNSNQNKLLSGYLIKPLIDKIIIKQTFDNLTY
ncbi:MAG: hypothetical protein WCO54_08555 [Bacteroidota bacterium]